MSPRDPLPVISDAVARLYKANVGRGPRAVVTHFAGGDALVCLLEGTLSATEQRMIDQGEHDRVDEIRRAYEATSAGDFRDAVRDATGRAVRALTIGHDLRVDLVTQVFVLDPA